MQFIGFVFQMIVKTGALAGARGRRYRLIKRWMAQSIASFDAQTRRQTTIDFQNGQNTTTTSNRCQITRDRVGMDAGD
jgi:hypothetical protein